MQLWDAVERVAADDDAAAVDAGADDDAIDADDDTDANADADPDTDANADADDKESYHDKIKRVTMTRPSAHSTSTSWRVISTIWSGL